MILNYEQRGKHSSKFPHHKESILTSSQFASEYQFLSLAFTHNKVVEKENDIKLVIQPCLFDPKKGAGHMRMLEELCHEMHQSSEEQELVDEKSKLSDRLSDLELTDPKPENLKVSDFSKFESINSKVDLMIRDLAVFENEVKEKLMSYSSLVHNLDNSLSSFLPNSSNMDSDHLLRYGGFKRRKLTENDNMELYNSLDSTKNANDEYENVSVSNNRVWTND